MCGASSQQKQAYNNQVNVTKDITGQMSTIFGDNQNILGSLTTSLSPIVSAGPNQYGFNPTEDAALRTQTTDQNAAANQTATNAVRSELAGEGGGTAYLPSGSEASIEATLAQTEAQKQADAQLGITSAGYAQGNKNYEEAVNELPTATAQIENPEIGAENAANSAAGAQSEAGNQITQANDAWVAPVAGLIGSVASAKLAGKK